MTDPIFISFNPPVKAVVASDNQSFTRIKPKINSNVRELDLTCQGTNNNNKEKAINSNQGINSNF